MDSRSPVLDLVRFCLDGVCDGLGCRFHCGSLELACRVLVWRTFGGQARLQLSLLKLFIGVLLCFLC